MLTVRAAQPLKMDRDVRGQPRAGVWQGPGVGRCRPVPLSRTSFLALWHQKRRMKGHLQLSIKASGLNHGGLCFQVFVILL